MEGRNKGQMSPCGYTNFNSNVNLEELIRSHSPHHVNFSICLSIITKNVDFHVGFQTDGQTDGQTEKLIWGVLAG